MIHLNKYFVAFSFGTQIFPQLLITTTMNRLEIPAKNDSILGHNWLRFINSSPWTSENRNICANIWRVCVWRCSKFLGFFRLFCCRLVLETIAKIFTLNFVAFCARRQTTTIVKHRNKSAEAARRVQEPKNRNQFLFQSNEFKTMDGEEMKN